MPHLFKKLSKLQFLDSTFGGDPYKTVKGDFDFLSVLGDFFLLNHIFLDIDIQNIPCVAPVLPLSDPLKFRCPWDPNGTNS